MTSTPAPQTTRRLQQCQLMMEVPAKQAWHLEEWQLAQSYSS